MSSTSSSDARIDTLIHLVAGGMGGTVGAILTCPLEVVKTRLQSSNSGFHLPQPPASKQTRPPSAVAKFVVPGSVLDPSQTSGRPTVPIAAASTQPHVHQRKTNISPNYHGPSISSYPRPVMSPPPQPPQPVLYSHYGGSSSSAVGRRLLPPPLSASALNSVRFASAVAHKTGLPPPKNGSRTMSVVECLRLIVSQEGARGLFRGLGPNLVGVAPSRAIYFWAYSTAKKNVNDSLPKSNRDTPFVHILSAGLAGFTASTTTNPIWLVKTRLQLDRETGKKSLSVRKCIVQIHKELGVRGFWKGVTASYWGISETVIHFVLYEFFKKRLAEYHEALRRASSATVGMSSNGEKTLADFAGFMLCGACSKTCATVVAYPHEVARTRLREEGGKYRSFWQTLSVVYREEGRRGLYRGLATQLIRQIPNTAIMMSTYELTVYILMRWAKQEASEAGSDMETIQRHKSSHSQ